MMIVKKIVVFTLLAVLTICTSNAQNAERHNVQYDQIKNLKIDGVINLHELYSNTPDKEFVKSIFGSPISTDCPEVPDILGFEQGCTFNYDGLIISTADVGNGLQLQYLALTNSERVIEYNGHKIRVGESMEKLKTVSEQAYQKRGPDKIIIGVGEGQKAIIVSFNSDTNTITEIKFVQVIL